MGTAARYTWKDTRCGDNVPFQNSCADARGPLRFRALNLAGNLAGVLRRPRRCLRGHSSLVQELRLRFYRDCQSATAVREVYLEDIDRIEARLAALEANPMPTNRIRQAV